MSGRPFHIKSGRASPGSTGSSTRRSWEEGSMRYDSDGESMSDTDSCGSSLKNFSADFDPLSPRSDSPMSSSSTGTSGLTVPPSPLSFGFDPESLQFYQTVKPSAALLEKSIDSLPHGSDMKNTLIHIRHQMKKSLLRLKELEDQVKNIPTLQVRLSVLQEEKRQLLRQLQAVNGNKKRRGYGQDLYLNSLRQRGCKSDTEDDNNNADEFSSIRRKLRQRLHSAGDQPNEETICDRCKGESLSVGSKLRIPRSRGTQTKIEGINSMIWKGKHVWRNDTDVNGNLISSNHRKVETRSVGVGMMRSFTKESGVGNSVAVLTVKNAGTQSSVAKVDAGCDVMETMRHDQASVAKPCVKSKGTSTEGVTTELAPPKSESRNTATQTSISEPYVSIGVGICAVDDEFCIRCATVEASLTTKTVDEIMSSHIDLPVCRSLGVGNTSIYDNYSCDRCCNLKMKDAGSGDLGLEDPYLCQRCSSIRTVDTASGNLSLKDSYYCDKCYNLKTRAVGSGDSSISENPCEKCDSAKKTLRKTQSIGVGSSRVTDVYLDTKKTRSFGTGDRSISDLLCDKCANCKTKTVASNTVAMDTRTVGVSNNCVTDSFCDRCLNVRTRSLGVGECCLSDNFCERCFNHQTRTIGTGDYDVNDNACDTKATADCYIKGPKVIHINGNSKKTEISGYVTKKYSTSDECMDSSETSETDGSTLTGISDTLESDDDSIDHDNPSSDSAGQMSEPTDTSSGFHPSRLRISEDVVLACKLINGHLYKGKEIGREQMISCMGTVESNWFERVSSAKCRSDVIRSYVKTFRTHIPVLLETIINLSDAEGNNALHYSVTFRNWKVVNVLLNSGCVNVDLANKAAYTSLMLAALTGYQRQEYQNVARRLMEMGDVNKRHDETGQTALMLAVSRGRLDMVELLLETDADINAQDYEGSTATMCACEHGHTAIARRLLAQPDCNSTLEDNEESTALSIAMDRNFKDIAVLIYAHSNFSSPPAQGNKRTSVV